MLRPASMARWAAPRTISGTSVSHTPCERLMPPTRVHSIVMLRISDWRRNATRVASESLSCMSRLSFIAKATLAGLRIRFWPNIDDLLHACANLSLLIQQIDCVSAVDLWVLMKRRADGV